MLAIAALLLGTGPVADDPVRAAMAARAVLRRCGDNEAALAAAPDSDWKPAKSMGDAHAELRASLGAAIPRAATRIMVYGIGGDLETSRHSIVLTREAGGGWRFDAVGESTVWIKDAKPSPFPHKTGSVSAAGGKRIDAIVGDPCFLAEPAALPHFGPGTAPAVGALAWTIETVTPRAERRFTMYGAPDSQSGTLLKMIFGYLR